MKTGIKFRNSILCGMFALAGTALAVGWNASEAEAAKIFGSKDVTVTIDYDQQTMCITDSGKDAQLQVGVAAYKPATKTRDAYLAVSAWEIYDNTVNDGVTIDLSRLKNTNDNYIEIKGNNNSEPIAILFPKVEKGVIASYNAKTGQVEVYSSAAAKKDGESPITEGLEYRTATGRWTTIENMEDHDISKYQQGGATLYYRMSAQYDGVCVSGKTAVPLNVKDVPEEIDGVPLFTAGSFAGVEKKVTIAKLANGPKITVNYVTGQLSLGVGQEYRTFDANLQTANSLPDFTPQIDIDAKKVELTSLNLDKSFILELRKAAVEEKSLASKATQLVCAKQGITSGRFDENPVNSSFDIINETTIASRVSVTTDDEVESEDGEELDSIGAMELYGEYDEKTKRYTLNIYNYNQLYAYDIIVMDAKATFDENVKGCTAVAKKTTKVKKLTIAGDGKVVYVRRQANAALKSWRTEWKAIGKLVPKEQ